MSAKRLLLALVFVSLCGVVRPADSVTYPLWPDGSANNPAQGARPALEIFAPFSPEHAIPATVVILPGGGYAGLSRFERLFAEYFRSLGYTAVVVTYRASRPTGILRRMPMRRVRSGCCGRMRRSGRCRRRTSPCWGAARADILRRWWEHDRSLSPIPRTTSRAR